MERTWFFREERLFFPIYCVHRLSEATYVLAQYCKPMMLRADPVAPILAFFKDHSFVLHKTPYKLKKTKKQHRALEVSKLILLEMFRKMFRYTVFMKKYGDCPITGLH